MRAMCKTTHWIANVYCVACTQKKSNLTARALLMVPYCCVHFYTRMFSVIAFLLQATVRNDKNPYETAVLKYFIYGF